eukprot:943490-Rhodomonas_salina.1
MRFVGAVHRRQACARAGEATEDHHEGVRGPEDHPDQRGARAIFCSQLLVHNFAPAVCTKP